MSVPASGHDHSAHDAHDAHSSHVMNLECDGTLTSPLKGSWKGHVLPGCVFIIWGAWWAYNVLTYHLWRGPRRPYRGRAWYPLGLRSLWYLEPALKILVPVVGVSMELLLDHDPREFRYLYCPEGTKYAGRFALSHMNNWQHTASYPAFVLSGLVDIAARFVELPAGACQSVLGVAFAVMAFLMGTHEKHEPQDKMVHWLLFVSMALCAGLVFLEMALRHSAVAGLAKALAVVLQGAWLVQIAAAEFEGRPQWDPSYGGGAMFAPVAFSFIAVLILACGLAFFLLLSLLDSRGLLSRPALLPALETEEGESLDPEADGRGALLPHHHLHRHRYDSANHSDASDDNDDGVAALELAAKGDHRV